MLKFSSIAVMQAKGQSRIHVVELDRDYDSLDELVGEVVRLDGRALEVQGAIGLAQSIPWKAGEPIGLVVQPPC